MKTKKSHLVWGGALLLLVCVPVAYLAGRARAAGIPAAAALTYSGVLTDATGTPMTGSVPIQIALWDAATAGNQVCVTVSTPQMLVGGAFQVTLPDACTTAVHANSDLWVEVLVSGLAIGRTKLGAVPYAVVAAEASCGPTTGPAMVDTGAGFCIDAADRTESGNVSAAAVGSCATEGKVVCSLVQLCTAKSRNVGALGTAGYRVSDLMFYPSNNMHYLGGGTGANPLVMPAACSTLAPPGPNGNNNLAFRCCRGKG